MDNNTPSMGYKKQAIRTKFRMSQAMQKDKPNRKKRKAFTVP